MSPRSLATLAALVLPLTGCQDYSTPSNETDYVMDYPNGAVADLPHQNPGAQIPLAVKITNAKGKPVTGVEVIWDDGSVIPTMRPNHAISDTAGMARTLWIMKPLPLNNFVANRVIRAYLPGARHNPIEYRIEIVPCTRC
jgi:hypothetical protein